MWHLISSKRSSRLHKWYSGRPGGWAHHFHLWAEESRQNFSEEAIKQLHKHDPVDRCQRHNPLETTTPTFVTGLLPTHCYTCSSHRCELDYWLESETETETRDVGTRKWNWTETINFLTATRSGCAYHIKCEHNVSSKVVGAQFW